MNDDKKKLKDFDLFCLRLYLWNSTIYKKMTLFVQKGRDIKYIVRIYFIRG